MKARYQKVFAVFIMLLSLSLSGLAQHDTALNDHIKIIKPKYRFKTPIIKDEGFCEKLKTIKIPQSLEFVDSEGRSCNYFVEIDFYFNDIGNLVCKKKDNNNPSLNRLRDEVLLLLKNAKWHVNNSAHNHLMKFNCDVLKSGLKEAFLSSFDNLDNVKICE